MELVTEIISSVFSFLSPTKCIILIVRAIHKSLRDFRPLRYNSRDGHAEGEHVNRGRDTPNFCPTLQVLDMSTLGDVADVNPVIKFLPRDLPQLRKSIMESVAAIDRQMLQSVWQELDYRIDICSVTKCGHIEHLYGRTEIWSVSPSIDVLPFGVTALATVPQRSEIPEGLTNYHVHPIHYLL
jgi:hypothetical protein